MALNTTESYFQPTVGESVEVHVNAVTALMVGTNIIIGNGGYYTLASFTASPPAIVVTNLGYGANALVGALVAVSYTHLTLPTIYSV